MRINTNDESPRVAAQSGVQLISTRDLIAPLFRHSDLVVLSFFGILLGSALVAFLVPKQYQAELKILVKRERIDPTVTSDKTTVIESRSDVTEEQVQSEVELFQGKDLLEEVVKKCGLLPVEDGRLRHDTSVIVARAVRDLQKALRVEPVKKTNLISATYRSHDPQMAARVLSTLANLYLQKHLEVHRPPGAFEFFEKQTERYRDEMLTSEERMIGYDRATGLVSPELEKDITLRKLSEFDAALRETQADINETEKRISSLESQMSVTPPRIVTQDRIGDNPMLLQQLKSTLLTLELKRTDLLTKFAPEYPPVQDVEKEIRQTQATIASAEHAPIHEQTTDRDTTYAWMQEELAKNRTQLIALRARATALTETVGVYQKKTRNLNEEAETQQDLLRLTKAAEENYLLYLQKQEEARISDALDRNRIVNVTIAQAPTIPAVPIRSPWFTLLLGGLLASTLSVAAAYGADYLDPSFRSPQDLSNALNLPVLAAIPHGAR
jgi:uncharacterized protein involved in exopolysaccharide biosynthesis